MIGSRVDLDNPSPAFDIALPEIVVSDGYNRAVCFKADL